MAAEPKATPSKLRAAFSVWTRLFPYLRPHRGRLFGAGLLTLIVVAIELAKPWPLKLVVDQVLLGQDWTLLPDSLRHDGSALTTAAIVATVLLALFGGLAAYWRELWLADAGQRAIARVRSDALDAVLAQSATFHDRHRSGDLLVRLTGDAQNLRTLLVDGLFALGREATLVLGTLAVLAAIDWRLALGAIGVLPVVGIASALASIRLRTAARKQRKKEGQLATAAHETLGAVPVIQAYGLEHAAAHTFGQQSRRSARAGREATRIEGKLGLATDLALALGTGFVLWLGTTRVQAGALSPGELLVALAYVRSFYRPIRKGIGRSAAVVKAAAAGERVLDLLDADEQLPQPKSPRTLATVRGHVVFRAVQFRHADGRVVLQGVDLDLPAGSHTALLGGNGTGKTTLATLLPRLRDPQHGQVLLDGIDVRELAPVALRTAVAVVFQETILFAGTLRDNVRLGRPEASPAEVAHACALCGVDAFAQRFPNGLDTEVGERGGELSGGERQRVALARALVRDAAVYVFDEPSTGLDQAAEMLLRDRILPHLRGRTVLLITHDRALAATADRIVHLADGRLAPDALAGGAA
ncbi:MAG: ABC transporter ATP-binding protein/permease [Planctomycetes bacterium]|nr:ABC transporter ATP-binding protein/permease [Planctomycetota bacterium]